MPNHVINKIKFSKLKSTDVEFILDTITKEVEDNPYAIDFDKIIPEPRTIEDCDEDCIVNKDSHVEEVADRPWYNWYNWRVRYWGTKWGAYDCVTHVGKTQIIFEFQTAWSPPIPIIQQLALLGYDFEHRYADEDMGHNCGIIRYEHKSKEFQETDERSMPNSRAWARRLWGY